MSASKIIQSIILEYGISPDDFYDAHFRSGNLVAARYEAANRLKTAKYSVTQIARLLKRNRSVISNYLYPKLRATKKAYNAKKWLDRSAIKYLAPDVREIVLQIAKAEKTEARVIVAEWVRERAEHEARAAA